MWNCKHLGCFLTLHVHMIVFPAVSKTHSCNGFQLFRLVTPQKGAKSTCSTLSQLTYLPVVRRVNLSHFFLSDWFISILFRGLRKSNVLVEVILCCRNRLFLLPYCVCHLTPPELYLYRIAYWIFWSVLICIPCGFKILCLTTKTFQRPALLQEPTGWCWVVSI